MSIRRSSLVVSFFLVVCFLLGACNDKSPETGSVDPVSGARAGLTSVPFTHVQIDDSAPAQMHSKTVGDLDGDGFLDLIVASTNGTIYWYEHPSWTRHTVILASETTSGWSTDIEAADVDGDGEQDLVVSDGWGNQYIGWFENLGSGGSWSFHEIGSPRAHDIEVGDLDLDGDLDVVIGGRWFENTGDIIAGSWTQRAFATAAGLAATAVVDVASPWQYPDLATALRGLKSSGVGVRAIENSSEDAVDSANSKALEPFRRSDGSYRIGATFRCLVTRA